MNDLVYKVVFREVFRSHDNSNPNPVIRYLSSGVIFGEIEYAIGVKTGPCIPGTPIFTFNSLDNAMLYIKGNSVYRIFECEHGPVVYRTMMLDAFSMNEENIKMFWKNPALDMSDMCEPLPRGTVLVEWVLPRRKIGGRNDRQV